MNNLARAGLDKSGHSPYFTWFYLLILESVVLVSVGIFKIVNNGIGKVIKIMWGVSIKILSIFDNIFGNINKIALPFIWLLLPFIGNKYFLCYSFAAIVLQ